MAWTDPPRTWSTSELVTATLLNTHLRDQLISILPTGTLIMRVAAYTTVETAVEGRWLQCNGVAVSRTTYATLFNYLNSLTPALPFGVGNGSTTFNLPDMRGRVPVGEGEHSEVDVIGDSDGAAIGDRRTWHTHQTTVPSVGTPSGGNTTMGGSGTFTSTNNGPAYLVAGSFFIKYT